MTFSAFSSLCSASGTATSGRSRLRSMGTGTEKALRLQECAWTVPPSLLLRTLT